MGYSTYPTIKHETAATRAARGEVPLPDQHPAELALRALACSLGAGGYNAPTVDAKVFEEKIRWGIDYAVKSAGLSERELCAKQLDEMHLAQIGSGTDHNYFAIAARKLRTPLPPVASLPERAIK